MPGPFPNTIQVTIGRLASFIGTSWITNADAIDALITTDRYCYRWTQPGFDKTGEYCYWRININCDATGVILNYTVG